MKMATRKVRMKILRYILIALAFGAVSETLPILSYADVPGVAFDAQSVPSQGLLSGYT